MLDQPVYDRLGEIKSKTLVFFGDKDNLIPHPYLHRDLRPEALAKEGTDRIPGAKLIMLEDCGHFLQFEKPEDFNHSVRDFILPPDLANSINYCRVQKSE